MSQRMKEPVLGISHGGKAAFTLSLGTGRWDAAPRPRRAVLPALLAGFSLYPELSQSDSLPVPTGHFHGHGGCGRLCQADEARRWVPGLPLPLTLALCPCLRPLWPWVMSDWRFTWAFLSPCPSPKICLPRETKTWKEAEPVES